jgi:hypothetical protein
MSRANRAHITRRSRARRKWSWRVRSYDYSAHELRVLYALMGGAARGGKTETQRLHLQASGAAGGYSYAAALAALAQHREIVTKETRFVDF